MLKDFPFLTFQLIEKLGDFNSHKPPVLKIKGYFQESFSLKLSALPEEEQIINALIKCTRRHFDAKQPLIALSITLFEKMKDFAAKLISKHQLMGFINDHFCDKFSLLADLPDVNEQFFLEIVNFVILELDCTKKSINLNQSNQDHHEKKPNESHDEIQRLTAEKMRLREIITRTKDMALEYPDDIKSIIQPFIQALSEIDQ